MWRARDRLSQTTQVAWERSRKNIRKRRVCDRVILPGQRTIASTQKAPSQLESFSLRNGVIAASGQENMLGRWMIGDRAVVRELLARFGVDDGDG
jgi:hypothetical protein